MPDPIRYAPAYIIGLLFSYAILRLSLSMSHSDGRLFVTLTFFALVALAIMLSRKPKGDKPR